MTAEDIQRLVRLTVRETLLALGIDVDKPLEVQADLHALRDLRKFAQTARRNVVLTLIGAVLVALAGATWVGVKAALRG